MKAIDIHKHLKSVGTWADWEGLTCDGFKYGDPQTEIEGIAVGWISTLSALREAVDSGCNMFITHEPTFYSHMEDDKSVFDYPNAKEKVRFLDETGLVVYRCHDVWDVFPEIGIVDSWAEGLGLEGKPLKTQKYYAVYEIGPIKVIDLAKRIGKRVKELGQDTVQVVGDMEKSVSRLAIGTGAITNVRTMFDMGADVILATDDGISFWRDGAWALDLDLPLLVVNHETAEIWGVRNMADYFKKTSPQLKVKSVAMSCMYRTIKDF